MMHTPIAAPQSQDPQNAAAHALDAVVQSRLARASGGLSPVALALAQADWALHLAASPGRRMLLAQRALELAQQAWAHAGEVGPDAPDTDSRFADPAWSGWPYHAWKEGFKACDAWWREAAEVDGLTRHHQQMLSFFTRQALDALSPSNWGWTNPEVPQQAQRSAGRSLLDGMQHAAQDTWQQYAERANPAAEALPPLPYAVGQDVAITPGQVVFRNQLIELIRYAPATETVYPEPLLIVPSCIMKYYILDLSPRNSLVRYLVGQGHVVYMLSWRNPDESDRDLGMDDYLSLGVFDAMAAVRADSGAERIHALGYCLGGTFLAIAAAALDGVVAREGAARLPALATVTLLAAQTDFTEPGELGVFIDDEQIRALAVATQRQGYFSGRQMADTFRFINSRDLVWTRATRRYLLGQEETGNDMMSWNADTTRLPARMHAEYLSWLFLDNALAAGRYRVGGDAVALRDIHVPLLVVGTERDHVSPWRSVYKIHLLVDADIRFILASGGHNAGIVAEPGHPRRSFQMADSLHGSDWIEPEAWQAQAPVQPGSWWPVLDAWLAERSGPRVAAHASGASTALCDAPGTYVMTRYAD